MSDRRRTRKNHIRAARNWLGQAEHSLDQEDDVQGDLKLMLAKAELSRAADSPRVSRFKRWGLRLLPAAAAILLAAAGMAVFQALPSEPAAPQAVSLPVQETPAKKPLAVGIPTDAPPDETDLPVPEKKSLPTEVDRRKVQEEPALPAANPPQHVSGASAAANPLPGQVPDAEKQRLMQSAGKVLRQ